MRWVRTVVERPDATLVCWDGGGPNPPVLLLHGLAGYAGEWAETAAALESRFRVVAMDQRGHGQSTRRPADVSRAAFTADVVAVIDQVLGGRAVTLIGQSMGAHTAMLVAAAYPTKVTRLVMIEAGVGGGGPDVVDRVAQWLTSWPVPFPDRAAAVQFFDAGSLTAAETWAAGLEARPGGLWPRFDAATLVDSLSGVQERACWQEWASVRQPTLLVLGEHSAIDNEEVARIRAARPATVVVVVPDAAHDVHLEQPTAWLTALQLFLDETASR